MIGELEEEEEEVRVGVALDLGVDDVVASCDFEVFNGAAEEEEEVEEVEDGLIEEEEEDAGVEAREDDEDVEVEEEEVEGVEEEETRGEVAFLSAEDRESDSLSLSLSLFSDFSFFSSTGLGGSPLYSSSVTILGLACCKSA